MRYNVFSSTHPIKVVYITFPWLVKIFSLSLNKPCWIHRCARSKSLLTQNLYDVCHGACYSERQYPNSYNRSIMRYEHSHVCVSTCAWFTLKFLQSNCTLQRRPKCAQYHWRNKFEAERKWHVLYEGTFRAMGLEKGDGNICLLSLSERMLCH